MNQFSREGAAGFVTETALSGLQRRVIAGDQHGRFAGRQKQRSIAFDHPQFPLQYKFKGVVRVIDVTAGKVLVKHTVLRHCGPEGICTVIRLEPRIRLAAGHDFGLSRVMFYVILNSHIA